LEINESGSAANGKEQAPSRRNGKRDPHDRILTGSRSFFIKRRIAANGIEHGKNDDGKYRNDNGCQSNAHRRNRFGHGFEIPSSEKIFKKYAKVGSTVCAEEDPREANENERPESLPERKEKRIFLDMERFMQSLTRFFRHHTDDLINTVQATPDDKRPACAVPQTADKEYDEQIEIMSCFGATVAAERNIEIIAEPGGKADMPSRPEFLNASCAVRTVKVLHKADTHHSRAADGNIRITREVAIDLNGEQNGSDDDTEPRCRFGTVIDCIDKFRKQIGNDDLFEKADCHFLQTDERVVGFQFMRFLELREQIVGTFDRTRNELRKEGNEKRIPTEMAFRFDIAAVNVNNVRKRLERIEGNADGKNQFERNEICFSAEKIPKGNGRIRKEVEIFEEKQNAERRDERDGKPEFFAAFIFRFFNDDGADVRNGRCEKNQNDQRRIPDSVENITCGKKQGPLELLRQNEIQKENERIEDQKFNGIENHTAFLLSSMM